MTAEIRNEYSTVVEPVIVTLGKSIPTGVAARQNVTTSQFVLGVYKQSLCEARIF
jgi:hypothetical protein